MGRLNWPAICTIGTMVVAAVILWNAIKDVSDDVTDLRERMTRVETIIDERLPRQQAAVPDGESPAAGSPP